MIVFATTGAVLRGLQVVLNTECTEDAEKMGAEERTRGLGGASMGNGSKEV
jgi:hypothetical protein